MTFSNRYLRDLGGASLASVAATLIDALVYSILLWTLVRNGVFSVGFAAAIAAIFGGGVHYTLSRFWVFGRFNAPLKQSALTYFVVSWLGALAHGTFTTILVGAMGTVVGASVGWALSKGVIWLFWTYPLSRYVVFGGLGARSTTAPSADEVEASK
ncbi:GtrA family protein [Bradymonas sediminis]|uniref:Uncharacterized protein n=1 Tax=Bradymonas sediminis TaxID=1548548 RepID=A0A2Z4FQK8_9DELT|nr:GtrA family protein [Bradymonas sediminis]AWV91172.1 hypothetical protein DN745_18310 [Bradymonas sediminis]TDP73735.1 GtrA-like protein [Bradymonas sediminis]